MHVVVVVVVVAVFQVYVRKCFGPHQHFTYVTMDQDISWAVHICSTSVFKYRKRPFKQHQHLALKHRLIPKKEVLIIQYYTVLFILMLCTK